MTRMQARLLPDGQRLHLQDGPIDLIIGGDGEREKAFAAAAARFESVLDELCAELPLLRRRTGAEPKGPVAERMWMATLYHARKAFITPMAAVAGAVADEILDVMTEAAELRRAYVNNGGDIAIHLAEGESYCVGLVNRPDAPALFADTEISAANFVGGIATSGWRGRSFSLGIADAVTVLADCAAAADAATTLIANAVDLPNHPAVTRVPAREIQPDSDLGDRCVTRSVGPLTHCEIMRALCSGLLVAREMQRAGVIISAALHLCGKTATLGLNTSGERMPLFPLPLAGEEGTRCLLAMGR